MFRLGASVRSGRRRGLPLPIVRRWRALLRRKPARWLMLAAPLAIVSAFALTTLPGAPSQSDIGQAWELAGRVGVVIATAVIGRAMLNNGR